MHQEALQAGKVTEGEITGSNQSCPTPALASALPVLGERHCSSQYGLWCQQKNAAKSSAFQLISQFFVQNTKHHVKLCMKATTLLFPFTNTQIIRHIMRSIRFLLIYWSDMQSHWQKVTKSQRQRLKFWEIFILCATSWLILNPYSFKSKSEHCKKKMVKNKAVQNIQ